MLSSAYFLAILSKTIEKMDFSASKGLILILVAISFLIFFNFSASPPSTTTSSPVTTSTETTIPQVTNSSSSFSSSSSSSSITLIVPALELHPTCEIARKLNELSKQQQQGNTKETKLFSQVSVRSDHICFKHGGHVPGSTRRGIAALESFSSKKMQQKVRNFDDLEWRIRLTGNDNSLQMISPKNEDYSSLFVFPPQEWKIKFPPQSRISYVEIENCLVLFDGKSDYSQTRLFSPVVSKEEKVRTIPLSGVYSIVSNNWPQTLTTSFQIHALEEIPESALQNPQNKIQVAKVCRNDQKQTGSEFCAKFIAAEGSGKRLSRIKYAYFQMPTDFISSYHVTVEVTLTMFHAVFRSLLVSSKPSGSNPSESFWNSIVSKYHLMKQQGKGKEMFQLPCKSNFNQSSSVVITSKPKKAMWGFKPKSCKFGSAICLSTVWASMYVTLFSFLTNGARIHYEGGGETDNDCPLALTSTGKERGDFLVKGLDYSNSNNKNDLMILESVETLQVGYPTFCEPLWGLDPILIHDYYSFNSAKITPSDQRDVSASDSRLTKALKECDLLLWMMRNIMIEASSIAKEKSSGTHGQVSTNTSIAVTLPKRVKIVYATRRGDWARDVLNEEVLLRKLDAHISQKYYSHNNISDEDDNKNKNTTTTSTSSSSSKSHYSHISVVKFSGKLQDQILKVASSPKRDDDSLFTIYIAAHGANILPSLFLPLNAGVITLEVYSDGSSGFYPYGVFPSWLHWKRVGLDRVCNRRLDANGGVNGTATAAATSKKKCKVRSPNNDDLVASDTQINKILSLVDEIVELQDGEKAKKGESKFKAL